MAIEKKADAAAANDDQTAATDQPQFMIQRVYVKDLSFEIPNAPEVFTKEIQPDINMDLDIQTSKLSDDVFEVVLKITVTAKGDSKVLFLAEVQQAGIFLAQNFPEDQMGGMLNIFCPQMLYPYAREMITSLTNKGGFPPLYLQPVNFEALYMAQQEEKK